MAIYDKIGPYLKTVQAFVGSTAVLLTTIGVSTQALSPKVAVPIGVGGVALTTFNVWLIKNEQLIKQVVDAGEDLYDDTRDAVHPPKPEVVTSRQYDEPQLPYGQPEADTAAMYTAASPDDPGRHQA